MSSEFERIVIEKLDTLKINYMIIDKNVDLKKKYYKNNYTLHFSAFSCFL